MAQSEIRELPIGVIDDTPENNMRQELRNIEELAGSIEARGLLNPVIVKETDDPAKYKLVAGFRRVAAHKHLRRTLIEVKVKPKTLTHEEELMIQAAENIDRDDPNTFEIASQLRRILEECSMTREEAAKRLNKSAAWVSNYLGLFDLPEPVQEKAKSNILGIAQIRFLHGMLKRVEPKELISISNRIIGKDQTYMDRMRESISEQIRGTGRKATSAQVAFAQEEREAASQTDAEDEIEEEDAPANTEENDNEEPARSTSEIRDAIERLMKACEHAKGPVHHASLKGRLDALQWVLGDEDVTM